MNIQINPVSFLLTIMLLLRVEMGVSHNAIDDLMHLLSENIQLTLPIGMQISLHEIKIFHNLAALVLLNLIYHSFP